MITKHKKPSVLEALFPIAFLIVLLVINIWIFGTDALSGSKFFILEKVNRFCAPTYTLNLDTPNLLVNSAGIA